MEQNKPECNLYDTLQTKTIKSEVELKQLNGNNNNKRFNSYNNPNHRVNSNRQNNRAYG